MKTLMNMYYIEKDNLQGYSWDVNLFPFLYNCFPHIHDGNQEKEQRNTIQYVIY